ncbi:RHS repeat domain-containing protein [Pedobacter sp.]
MRILQRDDYYAFGLRKSGLNGDGAVSLNNKYLYNGKELQDELEQYDYGARFYDPIIGRWNVLDMLAELAPNLTPFRYCFNNPINYTDPFGLWEKTANGYITNKKEDIERFLNMMQFENSALKNNPSMSQMSSFIDGEMKGGLGILSNGGKLLDGFSITQQRDFYGGKHWVTDQKSYNNFWHSVQGDLTPDALDIRTLGKNILGTTYAGGDNPKKYNGKDDYSYLPPNPVELSAFKHDLAYDRMQIKGSGGLFNDKRAIPADWTFVGENLLHSINPNLDALNRFRAVVVGVGLGLGALPKTIEYYMPVMVSAPKK